MPNYNTQFSAEISRLTPDEKQWCETFLRRLGGRGFLDFEYEFQEEGESGVRLWLHGDEVLSDILTGFVQRFLAKHRPDQFVVIGYAATCSRPLAGEFGGGMIFITALSIAWTDDADWLARQVAAFERSPGPSTADAVVQPAAPLDVVGATAVTGRIYWFIVDTDRYSFPFHQQLCAYLTGRTPLCGWNTTEARAQRTLGDSAAQVREEAGPTLDWTEEAVLQLPTEDGIRTPVTCTPTPGWVADATGQSYGAGARPAGRSTVFTAYQSVAISFERVLTHAEILQLRARTQAFVLSDLYQRGEAGAPITILGYRLVESVTVDLCTAVYPLV